MRSDLREHLWGRNQGAPAVVEHRIFSSPHTTTVDTVHMLGVSLEHFSVTPPKETQNQCLALIFVE